MFVFNVKMNTKLIKKLAVGIVVIILIIVFISIGCKFYNSVSTVRVNDDIYNDLLEINTNNYSSILKDSHENIDKYIGKEIQFIGFVYRLYDFSENQFVLAREMIISSDNQAVVVGFLCDCSEVNNFNQNTFDNGSWVEVEGVICKGNYHGDLPVIKVKSISKTSVPNNQYVSTPEGSYISSEI